MMNVADRIVKLERKVQEILSKLMNIRAIATTLGHHATHESGGTDAIKLDDLAVPDDTTDDDVTVGHHGLAPKRDGDAQHALLGNGTWGHPEGLFHEAEHHEGGVDELPLDKLGAPADDTDNTLLCTTARKGLLKKLPNDDTLYIDGIGNWSAPGGGGGGAPADALYITGAADGSLSAEKVKPQLYYNEDPDDPQASPDAMDDEFSDGAIDGKWTKINDPGAPNAFSESAHPGFLWVGLPELANNSYEANLTALVQGAPAGTGAETMAFIAKVALAQPADCVADYGQWGSAGVIIWNPTNHEYIGVYDSTRKISTYGFGQTNSMKGGAAPNYAVTALTAPYAIDHPTTQWVYLKLVKSTANVWTAANTYQYFISFNGIVWQMIGTEAKTFTSNPSRIGLWFRQVEPSTGAAVIVALVDFFRRTD